MKSETKDKIVSGVFYTAILKYSNVAVSLAVTAVLARLISPDDFGVVAVASVIIAFFSIFTDMGLSPAIIQHKDLTNSQLSDLFSFTFFLGVALAVVFFLCSPLIAQYYNRPILSAICKLLSVNLFFASINIVPNALFYRDKIFKYIAVRGFVIQFVSGAIAVATALFGGGLYALVVNPILSALFLFLLSIRKYPQSFRFTLGIPVLRKIFSYSAYQFLFNTINYFSRNLDTLLIGRYIGMIPLGYYDKAYRLMTLPLQNITQVITPVMHPVLSDYQNDKDQLGSSYEKIVRVLSIIGFPLSVFLFFSAKELVLLFFGNQWGAAVPVFQMLSLSVGVQVVMSSSGSIFQAAGDTRSLFICGLFSCFLNVSGILFGVFYFKSLEAIALCLTVTFTINFVQCYLQMYLITLKRDLWIFARLLFLPILFSSLLFFALFFLDHLFTIYSLLLMLLIKLSVTGILFIAFVQVAGILDIMKLVKCQKTRKV